MVSNLVGCVGYYITPVIYPPEFSKSHLKDVFKISGRTAFFILDEPPELNGIVIKRRQKIERNFYEIYPLDSDIKRIKSDLIASGFTCKDINGIECKIQVKRSFSRGEVTHKECLKLQHYEYTLFLENGTGLSNIIIKNTRLPNMQHHSCEN